MTPARLAATLGELAAEEVVAPRPSFVDELEQRLRMLAPIDVLDLTEGEPAMARSRGRFVSAGAALLVVVLAVGAVVVPREERVRSVAPASAVSPEIAEDVLPFPAPGAAPATETAAATEVAAPPVRSEAPPAGHAAAVPPAPAPPLPLRLHCHRGPTGVALEWDRFSGDAFAAYLVVRHEDAASDRSGRYGGTVVARLDDVETTTWRDAATGVGSPTYRVFAVDATGRVIGESNEASPGIALGVPLGLPQLEWAIS